MKNVMPTYDKNTAHYTNIKLENIGSPIDMQTHDGNSCR